MESDKPKKEILIITGNDDKFNEYKTVLTSVKLKRRKIDLPELQGSPSDIVKEKAQLAAKLTGKPCFVDDTCLCFDAWNDLPGPYIKDFIHSMGPRRLAETLLTSSENHNAKAIASIGYCEPDKKPHSVLGVTEGKIVMPRGTNGFKKGWDQIFNPEGHNKTYAEMEFEEKNEISHRKKAIENFKEFLHRKLK